MVPVLQDYEMLLSLIIQEIQKPDLHPHCIDHQPLRCSDVNTIARLKQKKFGIQCFYNPRQHYPGLHK